MADTSGGAIDHERRNGLIRKWFQNGCRLVLNCHFKEFYNQLNKAPIDEPKVSTPIVEPEPAATTTEPEPTPPVAEPNPDLGTPG